MSIKKKIVVWCALFALVVALVPLSSARAEDVECPPIPNILIEQCETLCVLKSSEKGMSPNTYYMICGDGDLIIRWGDRAIVTHHNGVYDTEAEIWKVNDNNEWYLHKTSFGAGSNAAEGYGIEYAPKILYTNKDIYFQAEGSNSLITDGVWIEAGDYRVTPTVAPSVGVQNQTLYMYSRALEGSIVAPNASLYEVCNGTDEQILIDLLKGMSVSVHGWTSDASGVMWYYCTYTNVYNGEVTGTYTGFIESRKLGLGGLDNATEDDMALKEQLETISAYVLSVPLIIGALFSFLPPWCLTLTGIGFSVLAIVMVRRGMLG